MKTIGYVPKCKNDADPVPVVEEKIDFSKVTTEEGEEKLHLLMLDNHISAGAKMY